MGCTIRPTEESDRPFLRQFVIERWGSERMVAHGWMFLPAEQPGFVAVDGGQVVGALAYEVRGDQCEVTFIDVTRPREGIGSALMDAARESARAAGCRRLWLITTNDNVSALRFYQRWGMHLVAVHPGAVAESRQLKPEIPMVGQDGIPLRDELELELRLGSGAPPAERAARFSYVDDRFENFANSSGVNCGQIGPRRATTSARRSTPSWPGTTA